MALIGLGPRLITSRICLTATKSAGIAVAMWCGHVISHFTTALATDITIPIVVNQGLPL